MEIKNTLCKYRCECYDNRHCFKMSVVDANTHRSGPKLRSEDASEYLDKHRVLDLFNNLTSQLIYSRPGIFYIIILVLRFKLLQLNSTSPLSLTLY